MHFPLQISIETHCNHEMVRVFDDEVRARLVEHIRNGEDLINACFLESVWWTEAIPVLREELEPREYGRMMRPQVQMFREHGASIRETVELLHVSFNTARRWGLTEEALKRRRETDRRNSANRLKKRRDSET